MFLTSTLGTFRSTIIAALENENNLGTGLPIFLFTRRW